MLKSAVLYNFNDILTPLYSTFDQRMPTDIVEKDAKKKPDCVITWTDYTPDMKMITISALQQGIPTFMVQHGRRAMRDYWLNITEPSTVCTFVWGKQDYLDAIHGGWHKYRVYRVGAPWFAYRPEKQEEKGTVIFDVPHWNEDIKEAHGVWKELQKIKGIRPIAKLIQPSHQDRNHYEGEQLLTYRGEPGHIQATYNLLSRASAVVTMMDGTLELMAHSLGVPVIHVKGFKHRKLEGTWQGVEDVLPGKGSVVAEMGGLEKTLHMVLENPDIKKEEAIAKLLDEAGDPDTDSPTSSITNIIGRLVDIYKESGHNPLNMFDKKAYE